MNFPDFVRFPSKAAVILGFAGVTLLATALQLLRLSGDPDFVYLNDRGGALWIFHDYNKSEGVIGPDELFTPYLTEFRISRTPDAAILEVQALKTFAVRLNGNLIRDFQADDPQTWKQVTYIDLAPHLAPGQYTLEIIAKNRLGPTAVWARCEALDVYSGPGWVANIGKGRLEPVKLCRSKRVFPIGRQFGHVYKQFRRVLPVLVPAFFTLFAIALLVPARRFDSVAAGKTPGRVRWLAMAALLTLGLNDMFRLSWTFGYDSWAHHEYIEFIVENWSIPYANDGWQMFQSPLFYMVSAPVHVAAKAFTAWYDPRGPYDVPSELPNYLIRIVPILCGLAYPELCYRTMRMVWPDRPRLQIAGILFGSLIPMNIYMSIHVGNEPMAGLTGGIAVVLAAYLLKSADVPSMRMAVACGAALGFALLAKISTLLLLPPCFAAFTACYWGREAVLADYVKKVSVVAGVCFAICGWYYLRNWIHLGRPFVGGWDPTRTIEWWQAPGYRMWNEYARFGEALQFPLFSAVTSVWDGMYSTFWLDGVLSSNYSLESRPPWQSYWLGSSAWMAVLPTLAILFGTLMPIGNMLARPKEPWTYMDRMQLFACGCIGIYLAAILYMHLRIPIWSGAKASYMSSITPCIAFLAIRGYERMTASSRWLGAFAFAWFGCWYLTAYVTYIITMPLISEF